ncbi:MAG: hypothetical protein CMO49_02085 [Verrucomicrobiales bacterium]|nr:hypothetical protein [Verrucomicrobiales bacterium]MEC8658861.1 hypothetical protein [Verrucomicrobiota bacterium]
MLDNMITKKISPLILLSLIWGLAEATFFFIVPDVILSYITLKSTKTAKTACIFTTIGALFGGLIMYAWGKQNLESAEIFLNKVPAISEQMLDDIEVNVKENQGLAIFTGPIKGQPYKAYAVYSGSEEINYLLFILITIPARITRFALAVLAVDFILNKKLKNFRKSNKIILLSSFWLFFYTAYFLLI